MRARTQRSALASAVEAHYDASLDHARHLTFDPKGAAIAKGAKAERKRDDAALLQQLCEIGGRTSVNNNRAAVRVARARGVDRVRRVLTQRTRADRVRVSKNADMRRRNARAKSSYDAKQQQEEYAALAQVRRRLTTRPVDPPMPRPPRVFGGCSSIEGAQERLREVRRAMGETRDRFQRTAATVRRRGERRDGRASAQAASRTARVAVAVAAPRVTYAAFAQTATAAMGIALPEYDAAYDPHCSYATTRTYFARRAAAEKAEEADREARIAQYRLPQRAAVPVRQPFDLRATGVQRAQETVSATAAAAKSSSSHSAGAGAGAGAGLATGAGAAAATIAPSQPTAAVAGVQLALRQQNSLVPFFQTVPSALTQLFTCALAAVANAAVARSITTLFILIMVFSFSLYAQCLRDRYTRFE
jgi:hypothetical protein